MHLAVQDNDIGQDVADNLTTASATLRGLPGGVAPARMQQCVEPAACLGVMTAEHATLLVPQMPTHGKGRARRGKSLGDG